MRFRFPYCTIGTVVLLTASCATVAQGQTVLTSSSWDAERHTGGTPQKGAFRIEDGVVYHLDQPHAVGGADLDDQGRLHIAFNGHRKFSGGTAILSKTAQGVWKGDIVMANGTTWPFVIRRR
jgi:hypothetical protein